MLGLDVQCRPVYESFPDISPSYVSQLFTEHGENAETVINFIMDEVEQKRPYPTIHEASLKRKRAVDNIDIEVDSETEANPRTTALRRKYDNPQRRAMIVNGDQVRKTKIILNKQFPHIPENIILKYMGENSNLLLPTYLAMERVLRTWASYPTNPWPSVTDEKALLSTQILTDLASDTNRLEKTVGNMSDAYSPALYKELVCAGRIRNSRIKRALQKEVAKGEGGTHDGQDQTAWVTGDCQCCFTETPFHRMVYCDASEEHMFCIDCARRNAEAQIGLSRHTLTCMATDGCSGGFSRLERAKFLNRKTSDTLDRLESEDAVLRAGLEIENCPFCHFAAEAGVAVEEDREFRCLNPDCMTISCRICHKKTHTPLTCEEAKEHGTRGARITIEEAMSDAVIRSCNKCKTPFIKESGCNKMTCPKPACRNVQCYICSENCDYNHFAERHRAPGGKCPLHDVGHIDHRHDQEMKKAQEETIRAVQAQQPDIDPQRLEIKMSAKVKEDDQRRQNGPPAHHVHNRVHAIAARRMQELQNRPRPGMIAPPPMPNYPPDLPAMPQAPPEFDWRIPFPIAADVLAANPIAANPVPANPIQPEPVPENSQTVAWDLRPARQPSGPPPQVVRPTQTPPLQPQPAGQRNQNLQQRPQEGVRGGHKTSQRGEQSQQAAKVLGLARNLFGAMAQLPTPVVTPTIQAPARTQDQSLELTNGVRQHPSRVPERSVAGDYLHPMAEQGTPRGLLSMSAIDNGPFRSQHSNDMAQQIRNDHGMAVIAPNQGLTSLGSQIAVDAFLARPGHNQPLQTNPSNMNYTLGRLRRRMQGGNTGSRAPFPHAGQPGNGAP